MFRRSLRVFIALALIALVSTVGYAVGRWRGPEEALAEAQQMFDRGEYLRCVASLERDERSPAMQRDTSKRLRLLRLRYAANAKLGNNQGALEDVESLLAEPGQHDDDLLLDHVRLLALVGRGEEALQRAKAFLAQHPGHWRGLELAGEAGQTTYQDELGKTIARVEGDVGERASQAARTALLAYIYRPAGDPEVPQSIEALRRLYGAEVHLVSRWAPLLPQLTSLRTRVQQSLQWFQQSLEAGGEPVAAFRGLAMSLDQSQRLDDLLILCESYRRRFHHEYVIEAGATAAWALVRAGHYQAAIATALRWLPAGSATKLLEDNRANGFVTDLLLARTVAAWRLGNRGELDAVQAETRVLLAGEAPVATPHSLAVAFLSHLQNNDKNAEAHMRWAMTRLTQEPVPFGQQDVMPEAVALYVEILQARNAPAAEVAQVFTEWLRARPADVPARLAMARYHLAVGKPAAALASIEDAARLSPNNEEILAERIAVARVLYEDSDQDGKGLLAQCIERRADRPTDVPDPVCYLLCAEEALQRKVPAIARGSAQAAVENLSWAIRPRLLEAEAELLDQRPEHAVRMLRQLREHAPDDSSALQLAIAAHRAAGLPVGELVSTALRECPPSDALLCELLRRTADDDPAAAAPFAEPVLSRTEVGVELRILAARAMARLQRTAAAHQLLLPVIGAPAMTANQAELASAVAATLLATAATADDRALETVACQSVARFALDSKAAAPALLACARQLAATHPNTAYALCSEALSAAAAEQRTGADFALAGRLALQLGRFRLAEEHWTAALAFADGRAAAEPLARLCFAEHRAERALQVYRLVETASDAALALRAGDREGGERLLREAMQKDGADLLAHAASGALGISSLTSDLQATDEPQRDALFELVSLLHTSPSHTSLSQITELAPFALRAAEALAASKPEAQSAQLLLARALCGAGQGAAAAAIHERAFQLGLTTTLLWREVALAASTPGYTLTPQLEAALVAAVAASTVGDSPVTITFAAVRLADKVAAEGNLGVADQIRAPLWLKFPAQSRPTLADAAGVAMRGQHRDAWWMLDHIRQSLRDRQRDGCVESMGALAAQIVAQSPEQAGLFYDATLRLLAEEGPHGRLVHHLLDHAAAFPATRPDEARTWQLLTGHLQFAAAGRDQGGSLARTIERLVAGHGIEETLEAIDQALRAHPAALTLWVARTALMLRVQRQSEGILDLRKVLAHGQAQEQQLELVGLAGAAMLLAESDIRALDGLPKALLDTPTGRFTRGLVLLRRGKPDAAVDLLAQAPATADGLHLLLLAEAILQSSDPEAVPRAGKILADLARDYPSSSLARYAASFARQLAGR